MAAIEVIKAVLGIGTALVGRLVLYEAASGVVRETEVARDPQCAACGANHLRPESGGR
jgi:adenylyltransferase/sulfurtransferase